MVVAVGGGDGVVGGGYHSASGGGVQVVGDRDGVGVG